MLLVGCVKDYIDVPERPKPKIGEETESLEASFITSTISGPNDPFWTEADFLIASMEDLSTENLYKSDGLLNMTGTFNGLNDFDEGETPTLKLRAAYDNDNIYILAEWNDSEIDASRRTWLWNGPSDPLKSEDSTNGWTSQGNDDNIALAFDISDAATAAGPFTEIGCEAACHSANNELHMGPTSGAVDIWNWSVTLSAPFGYALDMVASSDSGFHTDQGTTFFHRNSLDPDNNRAGPAYEWDGNAQDINRPDGKPGILDPAFFLLNKIPFTGDPAFGEELYKHEDKGCEGCHGESGEGYGEYGDGPPFNTAGFSRKYSRTSLDNFAADPNHDGKTYYDKLSEPEREDLIAYLKGLPGVPGYYLTEPMPDESITDIATSSDVNFARIDTDKDKGTYKVLFIRKLDTGNEDDILFEPGNIQSYIFGVSLMDNDGLNHIGALKETLIFKDK